ncbi:MAG TPA: tetratricopeptide repeat protein [Terriglobia bacterium]|nr:tetratricopeptide repeat protein [Terriglobia bacterium]
MSGVLPSQHRLQKLLKKGLKHHRDGHIELAEACYRKILKVDPTSSEAQQMLRLLRAKAGPPQAAIQSLSATLADDATTLNNRARSYLAEGKVQPAIDCLCRVVELRPESAQAHQHLGEAQERLGDLQAAASSYQRAVALKPDSPELHCHLARVLYQGGALQAAAELYRRALVLDPKRYEIYNDLGLVLTNLGNFGEAVEAFRRSLRLNPRSAKTIASLGYLFECKGDLISAADAYRDAIKLDPKLHAAYGDLGFVLYGLGELAEASDCFHRLRALRPDSAEATVNLGLIHLRQGDLLAGWAEYESRWKVGVGDDRRLVQRRWQGEPLGGERILLYAEQGFGDTLQFVRYVPLVAARGGQVVLEVQPQLRRLLSGTDGASHVMSRGETLPEFNWQCSLLSLPLAFGTELNSIPARVPYVYPDPAQVEAWRQRLQGNARRIGLAWGGNPTHHRDRLRSIPLEQLVPLLNVPGTVFYSLQLRPGSEQVEQIPPDGRLIDLAPELKDFADTAAIVANLDLVISVDSSVAHLAGAMGKPVWIMLNKGCDWRWFLEREDSPWYPTARLFRQTTPGRWQEVVNRIEIELRQG